MADLNFLSRHLKVGHEKSCFVCGAKWPLRHVFDFIRNHEARLVCFFMQEWICSLRHLNELAKFSIKQNSRVFGGKKNIFGLEVDTVGQILFDRRYEFRARWI